ncbi:MAG: ABC transporter permease [Acidimicrobiia bacterium]|nr:ABC transporter permease [Acidimicrobiia bacterium]
MTDISPESAAAPPEQPRATEISERPGPLKRAANVWAYRELLVNLTKKDLKVRYKDSVLGFMWSLLNPILYLVIFSLVFAEILRVQIPNFGVFLLSGLLAWNFFAGGLNGGAASIVGNASLVQKVWFPREILPLAAIGSALVHFVLQFMVLAVALLVLWHEPDWSSLIALPVAMLALLLLSVSLGIALAAVNVYLRDTQHLLELALLAWFWLSAIVYNYELVAQRLGDKAWLMLLNPMIPVVTTFQRVIYNPPDCPTELDPATGHEVIVEGCSQILAPGADIWWYLRNVSFVIAGSVILLLVSLWIFGRLEDDFAEEI